ncbi:hypothetical protein IT418_03110 [bacterium]|nr:hypothetical protein [bacterium]
MSSSIPSITPQNSTQTSYSDTASLKQSARNQDTVISAVLFIIALLVLCSLVGIFIGKSTETFRLDTPILSALPAITNKNTLTIDGQGPKKAVIEISADNKSYTTNSDKEGKFSVIAETQGDQKATYTAIARKKILFFSFVSERSNEVSTVVDKSAPNIKLVAIPKVVTKSEFILKGNASEPGKVVVKVNQTEHIVDTDKNNRFSLKLKLVKGLNFIRVTVKDAAGNETTSAALNTTYATGSVYLTGDAGGKNLPNSSGELATALSTVFGRMVATVAIVMGILGFMASSSVVWLYRFAKKEL